MENKYDEFKDIIREKLQRDISIDECIANVENIIRQFQKNRDELKEMKSDNLNKISFEFFKLKKEDEELYQSMSTQNGSEAILFITENNKLYKIAKYEDVFEIEDKVKIHEIKNLIMLKEHGIQ